MSLICKPDVLKSLVGKGLIDYVAMDIKASPDNYSAVAGLSAINLSAIKESVDFLKSGIIPHEFRTTFVKGLHSLKDAQDIGCWLSGEEHYFLQNFKDSGDVLCAGYSDFSEAEMVAFLNAVKVFIPTAQLRGIG